jgi:hypothetical protein
MPSLQSTTLLASLWPCHRCNHSNDSSRNKKRCFSCQAWRAGLAPLSAKGGGTSTPGAAVSNVGLADDDATYCDKNGPPNNASPCRDGSLTKSRISLSRIRQKVWCTSTPPSPPALRPMRRITASPPSECRGISNCFFGQSLTFAARST